MKTFRQYCEERDDRLPFYRNCVGSWGCNQDALDYLNQVSDDITYEEFIKIADADEDEDLFFVNGELDYAVSFHKVPNWPIAYFRHSAIEYVFAEPETIDLFQYAIENDDIFDHGNKWFDTDKYTYDIVRRMTKQ